MRRLVACLVGGIVCVGCPPEPQPPPPPPPPPPQPTVPEDEAERVEAAVQPLLDGKWVSGIVVGVADAAGPRTYPFGGLDGGSVVELGASTEIFTGLLLADAVASGAVAPDDPVKNYLPEEVVFPESITLRHLATHTSGLPRNPDNLAPADLADPYADYTFEKLFEFLSGFQPPEDLGTTFAVSNVGVALLARALTDDFEAMLGARILGPLGMQHSAVNGAGVVEGHDGDLVPVHAWNFDALAGAAGLRSTADDLVVFLGASLGFIPTPIGPVLQASQQHLTDKVAVGWQLMEDGTTLWHNGQTGGCRSFLALDPQHGLGVVVLADTSAAVIDDVGLVLLGKLDAPRLRPTLALTTYFLDLYVGRYRLERGVVLEIRRDDDHLVLLSPGEPPARLYAETDLEFYMRVSDLRITFADDHLVLHRPDGDVTARRLGH
ncbi:MAG: serine hydrolase [Deltaproteobacteria bacterium]|nr:serine hydrolase [Deltaproteobacteria bacterium]